MLESDNKKEKVEQDKGNREYLGAGGWGGLQY